MNDPSNRVVHFLIWISLAGIIFATLVSRLPWENIATLMALR